MLRSALFALPFVIAAPAVAEPQIISAPEALEAVQSGEMILIDIRSPEEWQQTGVAQGAIALTMHHPDFPKQLGALLETQKGKQIAMICATGGRTSYVASFLSKNNIANVIDVSEGMMGNGRGPGWLAHGLPLTTAAEAEKSARTLLQMK